MVSFHQKIMAIVDDLINHKFGTSSYPVRAYNRTVIVPYSLKDIQSCLVARYDKTKEGKLYAPSQIRKATQCFDELVDRSLATVKILDPSLLRRTMPLDMSITIPTNPPCSISILLRSLYILNLKEPREPRLNPYVRSLIRQRIPMT